nr:unnamed protein product [Callosobruchus chinensis]
MSGGIEHSVPFKGEPVVSTGLDICEVAEEKGIDDVYMIKTNQIVHYTVEEIQGIVNQAEMFDDHYKQKLFDLLLGFETILSNQPGHAQDQKEMLGPPCHDKAVNAVRSKQMGYLKASKRFGAPKGTVERYVKKNTNAEVLVKVRMGRPPTLPNYLEAELVKYCNELDQRFYGEGH